MRVFPKSHHAKEVKTAIFHLLYTHICMHILHTVLLYISFGADKENLCNNQELCYLVTISFILMTVMCDSGVMMLGEIRCWSLLRVKRLNTNYLQFSHFLTFKRNIICFYIVQNIYKCSQLVRFCLSQVHGNCWFSTLSKRQS